MVAHGTWVATACNYATPSCKCIDGWISGIIVFSFGQRMWHAGHYKRRLVAESVGDAFRTPWVLFRAAICWRYRACTSEISEVRQTT